MVLERAVRKLVGGHYELLTDELRLVLLVLVVTDYSTNALAHTLQLCVVDSGKGVADFELLGDHQLHFLITFARLLHSAVIALEIELLCAEDGFQVFDQRGFPRVGRTM